MKLFLAVLVLRFTICHQKMSKIAQKTYRACLRYNLKMSKKNLVTLNFQFFCITG
jgi:hypothetical protein